MPFKERISFQIAEQTIDVYCSDHPDRPLIVFHARDTKNDRLVSLLEQSGIDINLLIVSGLDWFFDLTPFTEPSVSQNPSVKTGGADLYLQKLVCKILPAAERIVPGIPSKTCIAGYSLAGLFALYALYKSEKFDRAASISGSLWFPGFSDFIQEHEMCSRVDRLVLSLGDKEHKTHHPLMKSVQEKTEAIVSYYKKTGIDVIYQRNPGNHFRNVEERIVKGVSAMC